MTFEIYKRGQGKYTRTLTFLGGALVGLLVARYVWHELHGSQLPLYVEYGVPLVIFVGTALLMFAVVNRPRTADFMIATEGEMKKVSWSSKKEVIGGTKVVIATTLLLALLLWAVDLAFSKFFMTVGVLRGG